MEELRIWLNAARIDRGKIFRRVTKMGQILGESMTEKAVWHIVEDSAKAIGLQKLAPHDLRRYAEPGIGDAPAPASATPREESWNKSSSFWVMFLSRRQNATWAAGNEYSRRSIIELESNLVLER